MAGELQLLRDQLLADVRASFPESLLVDVKLHEGEFGDNELKKYSVRAPAAVLVAGDIQNISAAGGVTILPTSWVLYFITKNRNPQEPEAFALALVERASRRVFEWGNSPAFNVRAATNVSAANLYSSDTEAMKLSLWGFKWEMELRLPALTNEEYDSLDDFLRLHNEATPVPHVIDTEPLVQMIRPNEPE